MDVLDIGQVFDGTGGVAQQRRRDDRNSGVLAAADRDLAYQRMTACNQHFILATHGFDLTVATTSFRRICFRKGTFYTKLYYTLKRRIWQGDGERGG